MGTLRAIFGPSKDEVWRRLAAEIGATYVDGGFWHGGKVEAKVKGWRVTLDTFTVSTGKSSATFTRMRAPYVNPDGFRFKVYRKGMFSQIAKKLGMQDVEVGDPPFDAAFIVRGSDESRLRSLLADDEIRRLLLAQPAINLEVKHGRRVGGSTSPQDVDELWFQAGGVIRDPVLLAALFDLFAAVLNRLCHIGSAYEDDPQLAR